MFHQEEDGSAVISGLHIASFVPLQHQRVNVSAIDNLANYSLRLARERGWLQSATDSYADDKVRATAEANGDPPPQGPLTFFYAGLEASLAEQVDDALPSLAPTSLLLWSRFYVSHVGTSSYTVYGELWSYLEGQDESSRRPLGSFKVTAVEVSRALRTAQPIPLDRRAALDGALDRCKRSLAACAADPLVTRLNAKEIVGNSRMLRTGAAASAAIDMNAVQTAAGSCSECVQVRGFSSHTLFRLRSTDIDFNFHVNQLAQQMLIINAFRAALADPDTLYPALLDDGLKPVVGDLLIRRLRIDYLREIPMDHEAVDVFLFPLAEDSCEALARSVKGSRVGQEVDFGFFSCAVPVLAAPDEGRYVSAVGKLSIRV